MNFEQIKKIKPNRDKESRGIYLIRNIENNKFYIGSSIDIESRWNDHRFNLRHNKHVNQYLQNTYNKHGLAKLEFIFYEDMDQLTRENILLREQQLIDQWFDDGKNCYNVSKQATGSYTGLTDIPIYEIYPITKQIINEYKSLADAGRSINKSYVHVLGVCVGRRNLTFGNVYCYKDDYEDFIPYSRAKGLSSHLKSLLEPNELSKVRSGVTCLECGIVVETLIKFKAHLQFTHKIKAEDYTIKHLYEGIRPVCFIEGCSGLPRYCTYNYKKYCNQHSHIAESEAGRIGGKISRKSKNIVINAL